MPALCEISAKRLLSLIGTKRVPRIYDIRIPEDFNIDPRRIPSSVCVAHDDATHWQSLRHDTPIVIICRGGKKLSHGVAAKLRNMGHDAQVLAGGFDFWTKQALPLVNFANIPPRHHHNSLWVTRNRPKIDRLATPWLIRRFIDPGAQFMYVPKQHVADAADRFNAIPFDIENVVFTHRDDKCSFDAVLTDFALHIPALDRIARIVRAADTDQMADVPQAAGLLAISIGLSKVHKMDEALLEAAMDIYDAIYLWADQSYEARHDWPH